MTDYNKLRINVRGKFKNPLYRLYTRLAAKRLGLKTCSLEKDKNGNYELVIEGNNKQLWRMLEKCKNGQIYTCVDEVVFEFMSA